MRLAALLQCFLFVAASAASAFSGQATVETQKGEPGTSKLFSGGAVPAPADRVETIMLFQETAQIADATVSGAFRADDRYLWGPYSYYRHEGTGRVNELFATARREGWGFTAGKKKVRWGVDYAWSPTDFVTVLRNATDPSDRLAGIQGANLLQVSKAGEVSQYDLLFSPRIDYAEMREGENDRIIARCYRFVEPFDAAVMVKAEREWWAVGGNSSLVIGQALEIHGEYAYRNDKERVVPAPSGRLLQSREYVHEYVMGAHYTTEEGWNFAVEYLHNGSGLDTAEWGMLKEQADRLSAAPRSGGTPPSAVLAGPGSLAGIYSPMMRREYLFTRFYVPEAYGLVSLEIYSLAGLEDGGGTYAAEARSHRARNYEIYARYTGFWGADGSEFGYMPVSGAAQIGFVYYFGN